MLYAEPEQFLFTGDSAVGANYENEATDFTHPPMSQSDWKQFDNAWHTVDVPVRSLFPLHGKPAFALDDLAAFKQTLLTPENVMQE